MASVGGPALRRLYLMRHGQAGFAASDRERPLTPQGRAQVARVGEWLSGRGIERMLCSPAVRTRQTAEALRLSTAATVIEPLYNCSAPRILTALATLPERITAALVVGHYPGIPALAQQLSDRRSDPAELRKLTGAFAPATCVELEFTGPWTDLHIARLLRVFHP